MAGRRNEPQTPTDEVEEIVEEPTDEVEADGEVEEADEAIVTPTMLAADLDVNPKSLRAFLRREFPRGNAHGTSWRLTQEQIDAATEHFIPSEDEEEADEAVEEVAEEATA